MWSPFVKGWSELDEITDDLSDDAGSLEKNYKNFCNRLHLLSLYYYKIILCHDLKKHFYWKKNLQMISHIVKKNRIFMNKKRQVHSLNFKKN